MTRVRGKFPVAVCVAGLLLWAVSAGAQVHVTDEVPLRLNGVLDFGYDGTYSNQGTSTHNTGSRIVAMSFCEPRS